MKKYRISSAGNLWDSYTVDVDKDGFIMAVSDRNDIIIGSKLESLKKWWSNFTDENAYIVEEVKDGQ